MNGGTLRITEDFTLNRTVLLAGISGNTVFVGPRPPVGSLFMIRYGCLLPRTLHNALVAGRCVSCDRHVQGSLRVMPGCFIDRIRLTDQALPAGWTREKNFRVSLWHDGLPSRWQDGVIALAAENAESAAPLVVPFRGDTVAVFGEADDRGAGFIARVDGVPLRPDRGGHWDFSTRQFGYSKGQLFVWRILATDLEPGNHTLEIEPVFAPEEPDSQLRIESICAAERRALKEGDPSIAESAGSRSTMLYQYTRGAGACRASFSRRACSACRPGRPRGRSQVADRRRSGT
jgi:hypothetical protein